MVARLNGVQKVVSSNLTAPTIFFGSSFSESSLPGSFPQIAVLRAPVVFSPGRLIHREGSGNDFRISAKQIPGAVVQRPDGSPSSWRSHRRDSAPRDREIENRKSFPDPIFGPEDPISRGQTIPASSGGGGANPGSLSARCPLLKSEPHIQDRMRFPAG